MSIPINGLSANKYFYFLFITRRQLFRAPANICPCIFHYIACLCSHWTTKYAFLVSTLLYSSRPGLKHAFSSMTSPKLFRREFSVLWLPSIYIKCLTLMLVIIVYSGNVFFLFSSKLCYKSLKISLSLF